MKKDGWTDSTIKSLLKYSWQSKNDHEDQLIIYSLIINCEKPGKNK